MRLGLAGAIGLVMAFSGCSDDSPPAVHNAEALCRQWDKVDAEHAAESATAIDETTKLAGMLPDEYDDEAALFFYPAAGDPGPNASGAMAAEAGGELADFRREVCGKDMPDGQRAARICGSRPPSCAGSASDIPAPAPGMVPMTTA